MNLLLVNPQYAPDLWKQGLRGVNDFLTYSDGVTVGTHTHRHVRRLNLGGFLGFLKRESRIPMKDYLASWFAGFGWHSKSLREWYVLAQLKEKGIACPEPLAVGEENGQAFLMTLGLKNAVDLPTYLGFQPSREDRHQVLRNMGHAVADLHTHGFTHPDLYAKHIFVNRTSLQVCFVDFQRTRKCAAIDYHTRCRDLAAIDASLHPAAVPAQERLAFLHAYLHRCFHTVSRVMVRQYAADVIRQSHRLLQRNRVQHMWMETASLGGESRVITYQRVRIGSGDRQTILETIPQERS